MNDVQHRKFRKCEKVQTIPLTFSLKQDIHAHQTSPYKKNKKKNFWNRYNCSCSFEEQYPQAPSNTFDWFFKNKKNK